MIELEERRSLYPRVSDIIGMQNSEFKNIDPDVLNNACKRGEKVHDYCAAWVKKLWIDDIEPEYEPYVEAFIEWATLNVKEFIHLNTRLYDDDKRFTGEFDMIVKTSYPEKIVLLDIKTSSTKSKSWPVQLAAYSHLCNHNDYHFDCIANLHLKKKKAAVYEEIEGKKVMISPPQIKPVIENEIDRVDINPYWEIFSSALACYDYFNRKECA